MSRQINDNGLNLIKSFEGIRDGDKTTPNLDPYLDPVGIWTIGYGHALTRNGEFLRGEGDRQAARNLYPNGLTRAQCDELLRKDLESRCKQVESTIIINVTDNQFAACVSLAFNIGISAFTHSTLLSCLNLGQYTKAAEQFLVWDKVTVNGKKVALPGLKRRRIAEKELFLKV